MEGDTGHLHLQPIHELDPAQGYWVAEPDLPSYSDISYLLEIISIAFIAIAF